MKLKFGITGKLFILYLTFFLIFYGTIIVCFFNINQILRLSETIVLKNNKITLSAKKMIEQLLNMEENTKKYQVLNKIEYWEYYQTARQEFEDNLNKIVELEKTEIAPSDKWKAVYTSYQSFSKEHNRVQADATDAMETKIWIPETFLNQWISLISSAIADNERNIENALIEIDRQGRLAARNNLIGLGLSVVIGLLGSIFLANSMIRPIRKLNRGIKSISKEKFGETVQIRSKDEFGALAGAFNEMTTRLREEEQMRSDFISMLSHEIRTPLTSIRESVDMIIEEIMGPVNQRQRKFLEIASVEIGRISDLLNHLMQVSRLESGAIKMDLSEIPPRHLVMKAVNHLTPLAEKKNIEFNVQIPDDIPNIVGTPELLHQVMLNIVNNAIKFSDPGKKVGIYVSVAKDHDKIIFAVSDSGPGISKEEISLIFNKYYRAKDVRMHMDGVGLGLSISRQIISAHRGEIRVKSIKGKGSIFEFTLPVAKSHKKIKHLKTEKQS